MNRQTAILRPFTQTDTPPAGWDRLFADADNSAEEARPLSGEQPSLLLIGCDAPRACGADIADLARRIGFRLLDSVSVADAPARLAMLVDADVLVLRCAGDEPGLDTLIARLDAMTHTSGTRLAVIVDFAGLDRVHAGLRAADSLILCEPSPEDLIATLAGLAGAVARRQQLHDIGRDSESARMDQLNEQLIRLSRTIEALVQNRTAERIDDQTPPAPEPDSLRSPARAYAAPPPMDGANDSGVTARQVRAVLRTRRLREHIVAADLFADPAWDILLDLMAARLEGQRVSVSSLCIAAAVPPTTALRWIRQLTERGLLLRQADPQDGRRIFIALSDEGAAVVTRWFEACRSHMLEALGR